MTQFTLKRASACPGQWQDEDFDVLADGKVVGRITRVEALAKFREAWMKAKARD
jgi:hypothetical protein